MKLCKKKDLFDPKETFRSFEETNNKYNKRNSKYNSCTCIMYNELMIEIIIAIITIISIKIKID